MSEERFLGGWTRSRLAERTAQERHNIWKRARSLGTADGNQLAREIERLGLPYEAPGALEEDSILSRVIRDIVFSDEGRSAMKEATLDGLPAVAGVDVLLHRALGAEYRRNDRAVATAQAAVAEAMGQMGYVAAGEKTLPSRCVAREGVFWKRG